MGEERGISDGNNLESCHHPRGSQLTFDGEEGQILTKGKAVQERLPGSRSGLVTGKPVRRQPAPFSSFIVSWSPFYWRRCLCP